MSTLTLVSHHLCPYVQRVAISLTEKAVPYTRSYIDLDDKPDWFLHLSPTGKVPVLLVADESSQHVLFESVAILEYLEDSRPIPLHPVDALRRAKHRAWIEFGSAILSRIAVFYNARTEQQLANERDRLSMMFERIESAVDARPWFDGAEFSLVDAVFGPIFRYFDTFDRIANFGVLDGKPKTAAWRIRLGERASVREAVSDDYAERLQQFLIDRRSVLSAMLLGRPQETDLIVRQPNI